MSQDSPIKAYFWQLSKAVVSFITVVIISNTLGAYGRGQLSLYLLYLQVVLMINEIFAGSAMSNWFAVYGFEKLAKRLLIISTVILTMAAALAEYLMPNQTWTWIFLWLIGLGLTWQNMVINYFQAHQEISLRNRWQFSFEALKLGLIVVLFLVLIFGLTFNGTSSWRFFTNTHWFLICTATAAWIWGFAAIKKLSKMGAWSRPNYNSNDLTIKEHSKQGVTAQLGHIVLFFIYKTPLFILTSNHQYEMSEIGVLSNTFLIADTVWIFGNAFGMVLHSKALNINNLKFKNRLATLYSTVSFWVTLIIIFLIFVVPEDVYSWVFGSDFSEMKDRLVLISPGILALAVSAPLGHLLHARNRFLTLLVNHSIAWMSMLVISTLFFYDQMECVLVSPFWLLIGLDVALILVLLLNLYSLQLTNYFLSRFKVNSLITLRLLKKVMHL